MTKLPPWIARNTRDQRLMAAWLDAKLDKIFDDEMEKKWDQAARDPRNQDSLMLENFWPISEARHGNIEPLRRRLSKINPSFADYVNLPRRRRGQRYPKREDPNTIGPLAAAAEDIPRIRAIWREHYRKRNRPKGQATAEQLAADRWDVEFEDLIKYLKKIPAK